MLLEESSVYREVTKIFSDGAKPVNYFWECYIYANGQKVDTYRIKEIDFHRNYVDDYTQNLFVEVMMPGGDFDYKVMPYRDNLEVVLIRNPLKETAATDDPAQRVKTQRFKGIVHRKGSDILENATPVSGSQEAKNKFVMEEVTFELQDKVIEQLRMRTFGGTFRKARTIDVIRYILGSNTKDILIENEVAVKGVDIAPNFNTFVREHVQIPDHTEIERIPRFLHENAGGVYSAGFGHFLQDGIWYVYSTFDLTKYTTTTSRTLTVINIPPNRLPGVERTYRETDKQVIIIATGGTRQKDASEALILNLGQGVRFVDANKVMDGFAKVQDNRAIVTRSDNIVECNIENRKDKLTFMKFSDAAFTDNIPLEKSKLAPRAGSYIQVEWQNALESILYPNMPTKYVYEEEGNVHEIYGTLVDAKYFIQLAGENMLTTRHVCNAVLTLFVEKVTLIGEKA